MRFFTTMVVALGVLLAAGCGGGGGGGGNTSTNPPPATEPNTVPITVGRGLYGVSNLPMVSVTVCAPGDSSRCYVIDNVLVDTGSIGFRVVSSALAAKAPNLVLPQQTVGQSAAPMYECIGFIDGSHAWGAVRRADIRIGGLVAGNIPIQVIGDNPASGARATQCTGSDPSLDLADAANLGANGVLGVNYYSEDCGSSCITAPTIGPYGNFPYFTCGPNTCTPANAALVAQVKNPVAAFASDNNGVVMQLPAIGGDGSASVTGSLTFGIDTRSNNARGTAHLFNGDYLSTQYKGTIYAAFIDSGSNALYFDDPSIPQCSSSIFFCPNQTVSLRGIVGDDSSYTVPVDFNVANMRTLMATGNYAFNDLAGLYSFTAQTQGYQVFDWGLPFFFGRKVYVGMEGTNNANLIGF